MFSKERADAAKARVRARIRRILNQSNLHLAPDAAQRVEDQLLELIHDLGQADAHGDQEAKETTLAKRKEEILDQLGPVH